MSRVLVVDDDAVIGQMISQLLRDEGLTALATTEPLCVYDIARRERPDLILLDLMMPYLDGWDELHVLRLEPLTRRIPIIFITAKHGAFERLRPEERGAFFDYLYKPFAIEDLVAKVRVAMATTQP